MKNRIGSRIAKSRKSKNLTQEALAALLNISPQAVSKWENDTTLPDVLTLAKIADITETSLDSLVGHMHTPKAPNPYQDWYQTDEYYWGTRPSALCLAILELMPPTRPLTVLDIGCGEGKDAVFLARCGYRVSGFDLAESGIEKARRLADRAKVDVDFFRADVMEYRLAADFDILFSSGVLHYIKPELRGEIFADYQAHTNTGGLHAMNVFVEKPFIAPAPEKESSYLWKSGELFALYHDWYFERCSETVFSCQSSGIPHQHAMDILIAKKM